MGLQSSQRHSYRPSPYVRITAMARNLAIPHSHSQRSATILSDGREAPGVAPSPPIRDLEWVEYCGPHTSPCGAAGRFRKGFDSELWPLGEVRQVCKSGHHCQKHHPSTPW